MSHALQHTVSPTNNLREEEHQYPSPPVPSAFAWNETSTPGTDGSFPAIARGMKPEFVTRIPRAWAMDDDEDDCAEEEAKVFVSRNVNHSLL